MKAGLLSKKEMNLPRKHKQFLFRRKWYVLVIFLIFIFSLALYLRIRTYWKENKKGEI